MLIQSEPRIETKAFLSAESFLIREVKRVFPASSSDASSERGQELPFPLQGAREEPAEPGDTLRAHLTGTGTHLHGTQRSKPTVP